MMEDEKKAVESEAVRAGINCSNRTVRGRSGVEFADEGEGAMRRGERRRREEKRRSREGHGGFYCTMMIQFPFPVKHSRL
ncbi:hypothetical protein BP00DRAFT_173468 [Aspergillus indologenus CBS 114.80]|uniref:Uncharacterized protein n=1 Tax=Aspergillus indologenus CBS 114.80 TaxID=1450541 RepID=A0A2V5I8J4_9EURO|nr:hypothetical protein BP00DRAFT_173468 [Aspergillus indologenus CBS 114.80]